MVNKLTRHATREEKIVNPGVYEIVQRAEEAFEEAKKREWVGLTDEEVQWIYDNGRTPAGMIDMAEAKLKEKNT